MAVAIKVQSVLTSAFDEMKSQRGSVVILLQGEMTVPAQGMGGPQSRSGHFGERKMDYRLSQYRKHYGD